MSASYLFNVQQVTAALYAICSHNILPMMKNSLMQPAQPAESILFYLTAIKISQTKSPQRFSSLSLPFHLVSWLFCSFWKYENRYSVKHSERFAQIYKERSHWDIEVFLRLCLCLFIYTYRFKQRIKCSNVQHIGKLLNKIQLDLYIWS